MRATMKKMTNLMTEYVEKGKIDGIDNLRKRKEEMYQK